ncbi:hypothetical protein [Paraburkholderia sp. J63]|uniref:hypothetical protein n=1 Tax=Paraburkholderia sp. J63 TaxID=2805434 RepID=UPI002ABE2B8F|nr:hypothetical protein [Paraburkholderia sp. J63]
MKQRFALGNGKKVAARSTSEGEWVKEMTLRGRHDGMAQAMLLGAIVGSWSVAGNPVRVQGIVPGVSLMIEAPLPGRPADVDQVDQVVISASEAFWPQLRDWSMIDPPPQEAFRLIVQDVVIHCGCLDCGVHFNRPRFHNRTTRSRAMKLRGR